MNRKTRIADSLDRLEAAGVIRSYMIQSGMPGLRWTVEGSGTFTTRVFSTAEAEVFALGAEAAKPCDNCGGPYGYPSRHAVGCPVR